MPTHFALNRMANETPAGAPRGRFKIKVKASASSPERSDRVPGAKGHSPDMAGEGQFCNR